jgi:hypothetical protein
LPYQAANNCCGAAFEAAFAEVFKAPPQQLFAAWYGKQSRTAAGRR